MNYFRSLLLLTVTFVSLVCSSEKQIDESKLQIRNEIAYEVNQEKPFTGKVVKYYENSQKASEIYYTNGVQEGLFVEYYENGQIKTNKYSGFICLIFFFEIIRIFDPGVNLSILYLFASHINGRFLLFILQ